MHSCTFPLFLSFSLILLTFSLFLTGCEKEISDRLQGKWQLKTVEEAGQTTPVDTVWYNFQSEALFMYQIYHPSVDTFSWTYGFRSQPDDRVIQIELTDWTMKKEDFLPFTDWKETARTFTIDKITGKNLILTGDGKTYLFDKY
ncbi:MAG: lipocalin-like domain-containing protein [Tannerella sp.]|nr:lipocalin-like domain-containing protein [Tannerella sp.]